MDASARASTNDLKAMRWAAQRFLPDKAIDLMDEACANVRVQVVPSQLLGLPSG